MDLIAIIRQFARFALVGTTNAAVSACVDAALLFAGMPSPPAAGTAFLAGALTGYTLNRSWTFNATDSRRARMTYILVQLIGLGSIVALVSAIDSLAPVGHFTAYIVATAPVTLATFFVNRAWTFSDSQPPRCPRRGFAPRRVDKFGLPRDAG